MPVNPQSLKNLRQNRPKIERIGVLGIDGSDASTDLVPILDSTDIASMARPYVEEALSTLVKVMRGRTLAPGIRVSAASRILAIAQGGRDAPPSSTGGAPEREAIRRIAAAIGAAKARRVETLEGDLIDTDPQDGCRSPQVLDRTRSGAFQSPLRSGAGQI